jgi:hypothetical protein
MLLMVSTDPNLAIGRSSHPGARLGHMGPLLSR